MRERNSLENIVVEEVEVNEFGEEIKTQRTINPYLIGLGSSALILSGIVFSNNTVSANDEIEFIDIGDLTNEVADNSFSEDIVTINLDIQDTDNQSISTVFDINTAPVLGAGKIDNSMTFAEAFSTARQELGAGGVFVWNGNLYNTFYAEELDINGNPTIEYNQLESNNLYEVLSTEVTTGTVVTDTTSDIINSEMEEMEEIEVDEIDVQEIVLDDNTNPDEFLNYDDAANNTCDNISQSEMDSFDDFESI